MQERWIVLVPTRKAAFPKFLCIEKHHPIFDLSTWKWLRKKNLCKFAVIDLSILVNICQLERLINLEHGHHKNITRNSNSNLQTSSCVRASPRVTKMCRSSSASILPVFSLSKTRKAERIASSSSSRDFHELTITFMRPSIVKFPSPPLSTCF